MMRKLKISRFNHFLFESEDRAVAFNSYTGASSILLVRKKEFVSELHRLDQGEMPEDQMLSAVLIDRGYLVENEVNELEEVEKKKRQLADTDILQVTIMPTMECNFNCSYCYEVKEKGRMSVETQGKLIDIICELLEKKRGIIIHWFGGEPLLAMDVIKQFSEQMIKKCRELKKMYMANMTTNGYCLNAKIIKQLISYRIYGYQITMDGAEKDHDKLRPLKNGGGTYKKILNNLLDISKNVGSPLIRLTVRCNFTNETMKKYRSVVQNFKKYFSEDERFIFSPMKVYDWGGERVNSLEDELIREKDEQNFIKEVVESKVLSVKKQMLMQLNSHAVCHMCGNDNFVVGPLGKMMKCTIDFTDSVGDVYSWKHQTKTEEGYSNIDQNCLNCFYYGTCMQMVCPKNTDSCNCPLMKRTLDQVLSSISISDCNIVAGMDEVYEIKWEA